MRQVKNILQYTITLWIFQKIQLNSTDVNVKDLHVSSTIDDIVTTNHYMH